MLASKFMNEVNAVVVENTFVSIPRMVDKLFPKPLSVLKYLVLRMFWDSGARIRNMEQPVYFIAGEKDELVPPEHMKELYSSATRSRLRDMLSVANGTHNDTWEAAGPQYYSVCDNVLMCPTDEILIFFHANVMSQRLRNFVERACGTFTATSAHDGGSCAAGDGGNGEANEAHVALPTMSTSFKVHGVV